MGNAVSLILISQNGKHSGKMKRLNLSNEFLYKKSDLFSLLLRAGNPTVSGMADMDYPLQGPGLLSIPNLPEISSVRRVPLPPELVEQFGRILMRNTRTTFLL